MFGKSFRIFTSTYKGFFWKCFALLVFIIVINWCLHIKNMVNEENALNYLSMLYYSRNKVAIL
jgi:hypothetical protein